MTNQVYKVLSPESTVLAAYAAEGRAVYEWLHNPKAASVVRGNQVLRVKDRVSEKTFKAVYGRITGEEMSFDLTYTVNMTLEEAIEKAKAYCPPVNYLFEKVIL